MTVEILYSIRNRATTFFAEASELAGRTKILSTGDKFINSSVNHIAIVFCRKLDGLVTEMQFIL